MNKNEVLSLIQAYEKAMSGCDVEYIITDEIELKTIKEETEKAFPWFVLLGAVIEQGSDPCKIESEEDAKDWSETINGGNVREITDTDELECAKPMLDLEGCKVAHIYAFCDGHNCGHFCLEKDY